jgi:hypothetical protein
MKRTLLLAAMIALAMSVTAWADQIMYFKDSSRPSIKGQITKTADGYEVRHGSGSAAIVIPESEVDRVEELKTPQDEYRDRLAKINPTDPRALYNLADWAIENNLKTEAKELLEKACKIDPTYENARLKLRQLELSMRSPTSGPGESTGVRPAEPTAGGSALPTGIRPDMLVSKEDIYRVRLGEIQPGENVSVEFRNKVLDQFIKSMEGQGDFAVTGFANRFRTMPPGDQAAYILERVDPGNPMRQDIIIKSDPKALIAFRTKVWPIIQGSCASARCHGSVSGAGGMRLFSGGMNDNVAYTNFLTLRAHELIDRGNPESSALLEYGLPSNLATKKHHSQINPIFQSREDAKYQVILAWIKSLKRMDNYTVDYKVPGVGENGPASAPADGAAAPAATPPTASTSPAMMPWQAPAGQGGVTPNPAMPRGPGPNATPTPIPMPMPMPTPMPMPMPMPGKN